MKNIVKIIEINEIGKSIKEKINKSRVSLKRLIKLINCWQDRSRKKKDTITHIIRRYYEELYAVKSKNPHEMKFLGKQFTNSRGSRKSECFFFNLFKKINL